MIDIKNLNLKQIRDGLQNKSFTALEITESYLGEIDKAKELNAFITVTSDKAIFMAKESDKRISRNESRDLEGIPISIKDLYCTKNIKTTAGSKILKNFIPTYESTITNNLWSDGCVMLGKLNNDEFAMGSSNETSYFGPSINPWKRKNEDTPLVPGGSSGGSAVAVSGSLSAATTATDTGGSIRQPASFTGTVGIKATYGRCSRWGVVAFASSLDQAGPITKTVVDSAIMLRSMAGFDSKDSTSIDLPVPNYETNINKNIKGKRIGIPGEYKIKGLDADIEKNWEDGISWLKSEGAEIIDISLPHTKYALPAYYIIAPAEASSNLARYDGVRYGERVHRKDLDEMYSDSRSDGFGEEVRRRILMGTYVLSAGYYDAYYLKAQKTRKLISNDFDNAFNTVDAIMTPTTPTTAFNIGKKFDDPVTMYLNDMLTVPVNMAGLPAISIPSGFDKDGLPMGLQLIGKRFGEDNLFSLASVIEDCRGTFSNPTQWWIEK